MMRLVSSMMASSLVGTGSRGRVERILRGDISQDDLHELFFNMRDQSGGSGVVSEVANFVAHPVMRTQGLATEEIRDLFAFLKFRARLDGSRIITTDLPASVPNALRANLRRARKSVLKRALGLNREQAGKILERVLSRITPTAGGGITKIRISTKEEFDVVRLVASYTKGGPLFNDNDLFEDFCRTLQRQKLLIPSEKQKMRQAKPAITLYGLLAMHDRVIDLGDGTTAGVAIASDPKGKLATYAFSEIGGAPRSIVAAGWLFETDLRIANYCEPNTAPPDRSRFIGDFKFGANLRLRRVD